MVELAVAVCMFFGVVFFAGASVGIVRLPDFYTRIHAASKGDTLSSMLILGGCALALVQDPEPGTINTVLKLVMILVFLFMTSPTAAHVLTEAAYASGLEPWAKKTMEERRKDKGEDKEEEE